VNGTQSCDAAHTGSVVVYVGPWRAAEGRRDRSGRAPHGVHSLARLDNEILSKPAFGGPY
jgi:hypothetical protein